MGDQTLLLMRIIFTLGTVVSVGIAAMLWRHRDRTGARALLVMMGAIVLWNGCLTVLVVTDSVAIATLSLRLLFVGVSAVTLFKLVFALEYTGREYLIRPAVLAPLAVPSVLLVLFAFTNPGDLMFTTLEPATGESSASPITFEFGIAAALYYGYAYLLNLVIGVIIVGFIYRSSAVYRGQSLALLGGAMAPWIATILYAAGITEFDMTALGSVTSGVLFSIAIVRYRLLDLMPIARDRVLDQVNDGVFVIDGEDRLVDVNPQGRRILATVGIDDDQIVGHRFPSLFDGTELRERYDAATERPVETTEQISMGPNHFQVTVTPIDDGRDRHVGWLLIAHDVTERKRREEQLELQNERLEQFASLVSHDLRNPLNVADGYLDLARETVNDEQYLEEMERSHDRMETIIEDVLALTREGTEVTEPVPVELSELAERAWDGVDTGGATVTIETSETILADPDRVRRLFENLFRNSVEHGVGGGDEAELNITVGTIEARASGVTGFYVEDDGTGIPEDQRDQVLEDGYSTGDEGTGLGLSIVESIASAHGWTIDVTEGETGGARFEFTGVDSASGDERESVETTDSADSSDSIDRHNLS